METPDSTPHVQTGRLGFTLLELLVVMAIMLLLMTVGIGGYFSMRRGAEMRGAVTSVQTTFMLARQQAVTKRKTVGVNFYTTSNLLQVVETSSSTTNAVFHPPTALPPGVEFNSAKPTPTNVTFRADGSGGGTGKDTVYLIDKVPGKGGKKQTAEITVWLLTGTTTVLSGVNP